MGLNFTLSGLPGLPPSRAQCLVLKWVYTYRKPKIRKKMNLQTKVTQIYSESFKRSVIEEFLEGHLSKIELRRKYNIGGKSAILHWMRQLGYSSHNPLPKKPKFEVAPFKISMAASEKSNLELQKEISDLKRKLEDEKLRSEAYLRIIQKAEEELKTSLKKKPNTK